MQCTGILCACISFTHMLIHTWALFSALTSQERGRGSGYAPRLSAASSFLRLGSCEPGSGARLPHSFPRATQIIRGNAVIRSQKAGGTRASTLGHHSLVCILCLCSLPAGLHTEMSPSGCWGLPVAVLALLFCPGEPVPGAPGLARARPEGSCLLPWL